MIKMKKTMISALLLGSAIFLEIGMAEAKTVDRVDDIPVRSSGLYAVSKSFDSEPVENGWDENEGKKYYFVDGEMIKGRILEIDGSFYGFAPSGIMYKDQEFEVADGSIKLHYCAKEDGKLYRNEWRGIIGGDQYYTDHCERAEKCVLQIEDEYYGFDASGFMICNELFHLSKDGETTYYCANADGTLIRDSWWGEMSQRYFFTADGSSAKGIYPVEGVSYLFSNTGTIRRKATEKIDGIWYVSDQDGVADTLSGDGWIRREAETYYMDQGELLRNCVKKIEDHFYGFDKNGCLYVDTRFTITDGDNPKHLYFAKADGTLYTDEWIDVDGKPLYYCTSTGEAAVGIIEVDGENFLFSDNSMLVTEKVQKTDDIWYAGDKEGHPHPLKNGWNEVDTTWYFMKNGVPVRSSVLWIRNGYYGFDTDGKMFDDRLFWLMTSYGRYGGTYYRAKSGGKLYSERWVRSDGRWYYYKKGGAAPAGIFRISGKDYGFAYKGGYLIVSGYGEGESGFFVTDANGVARYLTDGWNKAGDNWFYSDKNGTPHFGWLKWKGKWYYLESYTGVMKTGWQKVEADWYYFKEDGSMASNEWIGGYWLSKDGAWKYKAEGRWRKNSKGWWFEDERGWYPKAETVKINNVAYTFDEAGYLVEN